MKAAETHLLRALAQSKPALAHIYLANIYERRHQPERAIAQLETYLKENPQSSERDAVRGAIDKLRRQTKK